MQRKAILIDSSNAVVGKPLPGAAQDMKNWQNFLQSDIGGMWNDDEIADIPSCPSWEKILEEINTFFVSKEEPYFLFIAFSGHGAFDKNLNKDVVSLNHNQVIPVEEMCKAVSNVTKNAVIIIDACREEKDYVFPTPFNDFTQGLDWGTVFESLARPSLSRPLCESALNSSTAYFPYTDMPELRGAYLMGIKEAWKKALDESGPVLIQSCSKGEFANEQGYGVFSRAMVEYARQWSVQYKKMYEILNISNAFSGAYSLLQGWIDNYNSKAEQKVIQTPQISPLKSGMLPFAVNVVKPV